MIAGKKVQLRPIERDDLPRFVRWFSDPEVRRHLLVYLPFSLAQEEKWYEGLLERIERSEVVVLAIETAEGIHIGNVGLEQISWKDRSAELGIVIGEREHWGQGYGTDAILTLLRLAFEEMNLHRVYLRVDADNIRGIRCYEKCGFHREGTLRDAVFREGRYHDQLLMSVLRPDFRS
ncbi:MAG: GNAT family N-acetyltransferase [Anaerolineae bacterium]|jgi:RimJ/RimL family protein N-acetyltransferase